MSDELQRTDVDNNSAVYPHLALVGWTHLDMPKGISLRIECVRSKIALDNDLIERRDIVMTQNQALLLACYLLNVTGQTLSKEARPTFWVKVRAVFTSSKRPPRRHSRNLAS